MGGFFYEKGKNMKEQRRAMWVLLTMVGGVAFSASGVNIPVGTYVYAGSVLDWRHEVVKADAGLTIQAVATNGTVLASSRVTDPVVSSGVNFVLEVPVSTQASAKSAAVGDALTCVVISEGGVTNVSPQPMPPVAAANAITNLNVVSASATAFPYGDDGKSVLVSDDYLAGLAPWMQAFGKSAYEPAADWDGDGASNYAEYRAGTNPFDPSDRLRITDFRLGTDATLISFEYAGGHLYALDSSKTLTNKTWMAESFRTGSSAAVPQKSVSVPGTEDEDMGVMTLYLAPASAEPSMFYTIRAE